MVALLDVNLLVALFDAAHVHHELAHAWFAAQQPSGWATCPLTENGLVRILASPGYPGRRTTAGDAVARLREFRSSAGHAFWPDRVSVCDEGRFEHRRIAGSRQLTGVYLLGLAVENQGCLATFDEGIALAAVPGATAASLAVLR